MTAQLGDATLTMVNGGEATLASKRAIYERAHAQRWTLLFGHDRRHATTIIVDDKGRFKAGELFDL